ncbi:MAG: diacylglycerol/lipid kinase family protein [Terriglobales bacterium]
MPPAATRALLVFNPDAGRGRHRRHSTFERLCQGLRAGGWAVSAAEDRPATLAGYDVVVACGGDGTLHHLLQPLAALPASARPALAVAPPFGTANIMAHALGCPPGPAAAARWLLRARAVKVVLGRAETAAGVRWFATIASAGFDAAIVHSLEASAAKRRWGKLAFAARAITHWRHHFPAPLELEAAGRRLTADGLLVGLTRFYAGRGRLGQLEGGSIALALHGAPAWLPLQALGLATVGLDRAPRVQRLPPGPIEITTPGIPLELDGEPFGVTPARLSMEPDALTMLMLPLRRRASRGD